VIWSTCRKCTTCSPIFMKDQTLRAGTGDWDGTGATARGRWRGYTEMGTSSLATICTTTMF
jgi:hypothetical protein